MSMRYLVIKDDCDDGLTKAYGMFDTFDDAYKFKNEKKEQHKMKNNGYISEDFHIVEFVDIKSHLLHKIKKTKQLINDFDW